MGRAHKLLCLHVWRLIEEVIPVLSRGILSVHACRKLCLMKKVQGFSEPAVSGYKIND